MAPPQNLEAEQSVLGAVLLSDTALPALIIDERLNPDDFYRESHGRIYQAMLDLHGMGEPVDALTLVEHLKQAGRPGERRRRGRDRAAGRLGPRRRQPAPVRADRARERDAAPAAARGLRHPGQVHSHEALPRDLVDMAERAILEVAHEDSRKDFRSAEQLLDAELDKLQKLSLEGNPMTGTPSGFEDLDTITGGFQPGNLIILAARPSMGKSALMVNFAENAALDSNKAVALFWLEMSEGELAQRFIASPGVDQGRRPAQGPRAAVALGRRSCRRPRGWRSSKLYVDDSSDLCVLDVRAKCRRLAQQNADGLGLILIDYLQLMRAGGAVENRVEQIGIISRGLKTLARELEVPVIALCQLNRGVEQRTDKRPVLSDLRESGAIEQDADLVMFVYRDDYYDKESEREGIADLIIAKHRNGGLGTVELTFQKEFPRFMSYAGDDRY